MKRSPRFFYGWVIVAEAVIAISIAYGIRYSFPAAFYPVILDEFGWSRASAASIFSVFIAIYGLSGPIAGVLIDRFGPQKIFTLGALCIVAGAAASSQAREIWHFYLTFGVLMAWGAAMLGQSPHTIVLANWFDRRRGMAYGFTNAGTGLSFLFAPFARYLILRLDWPAAFLALAVLAAVVIIPLVALVPRRRPQDMGLLPDGDRQKELEGGAPSPQGERRIVLDPKWVSTEWTLLKALRTYRYWGIFLFGVFGAGLGWQLMVTHQVKFLEDVGYSPMFATFIFFMYGLVTTLGTLLGFISDRIGRERAMTLSSFSAILGILVLLLIRDASQPWLPFLYAIAYGLGVGIALPTNVSAIADLFQGKHFGSIMGSTLIAFATGGFVGPWLGGYLYDVAGNYTIAFIIAIIAWAVGLPFFWLASPRKVRAVPGRSRQAREHRASFKERDRE